MSSKRDVVGSSAGDGYQKVFEVNPLPCFLVDPVSRRFLAVNAAAVRRYGYSRREFLSSTIDRIRLAEDAVALAAMLHRIERTREFHFFVRHQAKAGVIFDVEVAGRAVRFSGRRAWLVVEVAARDSTPVTSDNTRDLDRRYGAIFANALDGILIFDDTTQILDANPAACQLLGWTREELLGKTIWDVSVPESVEPGKMMLDVLITKGALPGHYMFRSRQGQTKAVTFRAVAYVLPGMHLSIFSDDTARIAAEEDLRRSQAQLRRLSKRIESRQEAERARIAREIHDELGQALTSVKLEAASLIHKLPIRDRGSMKHAESILELADQTILTVRRLATELRPSILDDAGIAAAVEWAAADFRIRTGIRCSRIGPATEIIAGTEQSIALFRILQEALTNIVRHAAARDVQVRLSQDASNIALEVSDDGKGFHEDNLRAATSLGLVGMRERALLLGGALAIRSAPGQGTTVSVHLPNTHQSIEGPTRD